MTFPLGTGGRFSFLDRPPHFSSRGVRTWGTFDKEMYTGTLIDELYALVEKAEESAGSSPHRRADSGAPEAALCNSGLDSGPDLTVRTIPASASSERG